MMVDWQNFDYFLPKKNLALSPAVPRESSKIFIYNTKKDKIIFDRFYNLGKYLPKNSFLVLNNTKVLPARVELRKSTGGKVIVLLLINELGNFIKAMVDRKVNIGDKLFIDNKYYFSVIDQKEKIFYLKFNGNRLWLLNKLTEIGKTPVPLYLRKTPLTEKELRRKYQTIFARAPVGARLSSVAAPTASLHFTNRVFKKLKRQGIEKYFITLHVGLGTFAPITDKNLKEKKLHEEYFEVDEETLHYINIMKSKEKKLVAVGTTVTRTLESLKLKVKSQKSKMKVKSQNLETRIFDKTNLFIFPPYDFKMVDCLITNFHLPKSSLMMLVEAFLQFKKSRRKLINLYKIATEKNFRFYSFGDAMMIK